LFIESKHTETEKISNIEVITLKEQMAKTQNEIVRLQKYPQTGMIVQ